MKRLRRRRRSARKRETSDFRRQLHRERDPVVVVFVEVEARECPVVLAGRFAGHSDLVQNIVISRRVDQIVRLGEEHGSFGVGASLDDAALDDRDGGGGGELVGLLVVEQGRRIGEVDHLLDDFVDDDLLVVAEGSDPTSIWAYEREGASELGEDQAGGKEARLTPHGRDDVLEVIPHLMDTLASHQVDDDDCSLHGGSANEARVSWMGREGEDGRGE